MTVESGTSGLMSLAEQQVDDAVRQVSVFAKISVQLQVLKMQFSTLGVGADIVEHVLGDDEDEDRDDGPKALGRTLDQYL